jgi:signal transduction histidine kinase
MPHPERALVRASITDISERRALEAERERLGAQLRQAQKMEAIGQLTGGVAHDFNNLLTVIIGHLGLLELRHDDAESRADLGIALDACKRASALVSQLLSFSRRKPLNPELVDMNEIARGALELLERSAGPEIEIEVLLPARVHGCRVDASSLANAILNLGLNARDALGPRGGRLWIRVEDLELFPEMLEDYDETPIVGDFVAVHVEDEGPGISPEDLGRVCEPFFTTKEVGRGSGLGLSMVYGFVTSSSGHLVIDSEPGRGTRVSMLFPRADEAPSDAELPRVSRPAPRGAGERVLVLEDDAIVRRLLVGLLEQLGYRALEAGTGRQALDLLEADPEIDVLLADLTLPEGLAGDEVVRRAHQRRPELPVLLVSGREDELTSNRTLDLDVEVLAKPFGLAELADKIARILGR